MREFLSLSLLLMVAACGHTPPTFVCEETSQCSLHDDGRCVPSPGGYQTCAYPADCPSGLAYDDNGDLRGTCVEPSFLPDAAMPDAAPHPDSAPPPPDAPPVVREWAVPEIVANINEHDDELYPAISANGLDLYFSRSRRGESFTYELYVARRPGVGQPFGMPQPLTDLNTPDNELWAVPSPSDLELYFSRNGALMVSRRSNPASTWTEEINTRLTTSGPVSFTADGLTMYTTRRCPPEVNSGFGPCLFKSKRSEIGGDWSAWEYLKWPGEETETNRWNNAHISTDGLRMLLSSPFSASGVRVLQTSRDDAAGEWRGLAVINNLSLETTAESARWNATEDEIYLVQDPAADPIHGFNIYVSTLR